LTNFECGVITDIQRLKNEVDVVGTPYYMAPEIRYKCGKVIPIDYFDQFSAEIYSVGATLSEMLISNERIPEENINYVAKNYDMDIFEIVNEILTTRKFPKCCE
jgi:serine/threonine protein kinase